MARKEVPTDHYRLIGTYERLRKGLLDQPDDGRLDKQLSYWVLPTDRRLPIAFLDRQVRELLDEPFDELLATPGVGHKKIMGFFNLLKRAGVANPPDEPFGLPSVKKNGREKKAEQNGFDPDIVSEALWSTWTETVRRHDFVDHKLGRLAPTLQSLPTVIWHTRLGEYADRSLAQIRRLRTHGEKRVRAVLEVFRAVHEAVATSTRDENLELDLMPRFIPPLVRWLIDELDEEDAPTLTDIRRRITTPLIRQIEVDLGAQVAKLVSGRMQIDGRAPSVKEQADDLGVTRARIYQLLEDGAKVMEVRWPEGRWLLAPIEAKLADTGTQGSLLLVQAARELFYPEQVAV
ncbi:MAG: hypothetical protein ACR2NU_09835 [Aeoliella sp.]